MKEGDRLAALKRHGILDTQPEAAFDRIVEHVRALCHAPVALVSLVDENRQWFKAKSGVEVDQTALDTSVCALTICQRDIFQIEDLSADPRTAAMSLVTNDPYIRFYAGAPLITSDGIALGSLCVIDVVPRPGGLTSDQKLTLAMLADQLVTIIEMRTAIADRDRVLADDQHFMQAKIAEERYHTIVDSAIDSAIISFDDQGFITNWSKGAERIFGWSEDEILGNAASIFFTPEDNAKGVAANEFSTARLVGRAADERWHVRKDGSRFYAHGAMTPLAGAENGFVKALRDITAEHETRSAFSASREKLELATRATRLGQFDYFPQSDYLEWDDRCRELFGLSPGVPVSYEGSYLAGLHPEDREMGAEKVLAALDPRGSRTFDVEYRTIGIEDGLLRYIHARGIALFESDTPLRLIGTVQDVTADRQARLELRENIERVQLALAAGAIIGTWFWDLPSDRFTVDAAFASSFGLDPALGREGLSLAQVVATVHPDDQQGLAAAIDEVIQRGGAYAHQYRVRRADGKYYWIEANGRVDCDPDGTPRSFPGVLLDVEERRAVEQERDRVAAELRALTDTLEQRVAEQTEALIEAGEQLRQSQKMEAVGQLTGGLAHDFNNLLAGISGALEMIDVRLSQGRIGDLEKYVIAAQGAAKRAASLTHRLLAFSRRQTLDPKPVDVNALVNGMADLIRRTVGPEIEVEVVGAGGLWPALVDASQLENALLNLCINARDAMPDGGQITIETANKWLDAAASRTHDLPEGQYLSLCVTDTGTGMPPEIIDKIFDPFFTTKPIGKGTGLGLSMIYGFAQQSGGQIRVYSEPGHGTTMCIYLPRHIGEASKETAERPVELVSPSADGETVLVVDDEATVRLMASEVLGDLGYTVLEASDSLAGLKILQSSAQIDLLITDVGLPGGMNGRQMADAAREQRPDLKVLFITGYAENSLFRHGHLEHGMNVMTKPFSIDSLSARIRELISQS